LGISVLRGRGRRRNTSSRGKNWVGYSSITKVHLKWSDCRIGSSVPASNTSPSMSVHPPPPIPKIEPRNTDNLWLSAPLDPAGAETGQGGLTDGGEAMKYWSGFAGNAGGGEIPDLYRELKLFMFDFSSFPLLREIERQLFTPSPGRLKLLGIDTFCGCSLTSCLS